MNSENFSIPVVCDHRLPVVLREIACCGGGVHQSFGCSHWSNAMAECVAMPVSKAEFRGIQACSECRHNTTRPFVEIETPIVETAPVIERKKFTTIREYYERRRAERGRK